VGRSDLVRHEHVLDRADAEYDSVAVREDEVRARLDLAVDRWSVRSGSGRDRYGGDRRCYKHQAELTNDVTSVAISGWAKPARARLA
jgi:hypothetical protein